MTSSSILSHEALKWVTSAFGVDETGGQGSLFPSTLEPELQRHLELVIPGLLLAILTTWILSWLTLKGHPIASSSSSTSKSKMRLVVEDFPPEITPGWEQQQLSQSPDSIFTNSLSHPSHPSSIQCFDPATGLSLGLVTPATPEEARSLIQRAKEAQALYVRRFGFDKRRALLADLLDWVVTNQERICRITARESVVDANFGEILATCEKLKWTIANGEACLATEFRTPGLIMAHKVARVEYHPVGVMGCIVSWNYPFHNVIGPIISALMAGNGCVIKTSEFAAWSCGFWQSVFHQLLRKHDLPPDLITLINGRADVGQTLIECCDKLTFIGSPAVGKLVMQHASHTLTPVVLELGGKDVAICFDDCDYDQVVHIAMRGTFQNAGQNCAGLERLVVQGGIYNRFVADMKTRVSALVVGAPLDDTEEKTVDMGAITMPSQLNVIQALVDDAVAKGARLLVGGTRFHHPKYPMGVYYRPTLLVDVTPNMRIAQEEVFGPVMVVMRFETDREAVLLANSSPYGLGSSVFTLNYERGEAIASQLRVGMCNVNDFGSNYLCQCLPFGGVGISGIDRFAGVEGLRGNCHIKSTTTDKFRVLGVRTKLPFLLQYPLIPSSQRFQEGLVQLMYSSTWSAVASSLWRLAKLSFTGRKVVTGQQ